MAHWPDPPCTGENDPMGSSMIEMIKRVQKLIPYLGKGYKRTTGYEKQLL